MSLVVDWLYYRNDCQSCVKLLSFLAENKISIRKQRDAISEPCSELAGVLAGIEKIVSIRGGRQRTLELDAGDESEIARQLLTSQGQLRAPTMSVEHWLIAGYDPKILTELFERFPTVES